MASNPQTILNETIIPSSMLDATSNLAENLLQSEPFLRFKVAEQRLQADQGALKLLADFSELQKKIRELQFSGVISETDLKRLRALQIAIGTRETIQDHLLTQKLAIAFLQEVNQEISQLLGIDFSSLARRSGGCC